MDRAALSVTATKCHHALGKVLGSGVEVLGHYSRDLGLSTQLAPVLVRVDRRPACTSTVGMLTRTVGMLTDNVAPEMCRDARRSLPDVSCRGLLLTVGGSWGAEL